jgi:hypothetical protein
MVIVRADAWAQPAPTPDFRTRYGIAGVNVGIMRNMYAYAEARLFDDSVYAHRVRKASTFSPSACITASP